METGEKMRIVLAVTNKEVERGEEKTNRSEVTDRKLWENINMMLT